MTSSSPVFNDGKHIDKILTNFSCGKHSVLPGVPCYVLPRGFSRGDWLAGVCGTRIKKAGYVGEISPDSLQRKQPQRVKGGRDGKRRS